MKTFKKVISFTVIFCLLVTFSSAGALAESQTTSAESKAASNKSNSSSSKSNTVSIMLVGDLMCSYGQQFKSYEGSYYDFYSEFEQIQPIFDKSDMLVGNLEVNVSENCPLTKDMPKSLEKPYLNAPYEWLEALKEAGFDGVVTANNHCCDCGADGIKDTIDALNECGLKHTGTYKSSNSKHYFILEQNGIKVGFLAYANYYNQKEDLLTKEQRSYMLSTISKDQVKKDVSALKKAGAEYIIAYCHSGEEYTHSVTNTQKKLAKILYDCGVDYMVNSHSHCLQKYTTISHGSRTMPVWYGLGNFTSSMTEDITRQTIIVNITLSRSKETGKVKLKKEKYYPLVQVEEYKGKNYVLLPESLGTKLSAEKKSYDKIRKAIGSSSRITAVKY